MTNKFYPDDELKKLFDETALTRHGHTWNPKGVLVRYQFIEILCKIAQKVIIDTQGRTDLLSDAIYNLFKEKITKRRTPH